MNWKYKWERVSCYYTLLVVLTLLANVSHGQPALQVKNAKVNWPNVEVSIVPECNGAFLFRTNKQDYRLWENGQEIHNFTLRCPDTMNRCPISVALVFDASGSMSGTPIDAAKAAGIAFLDMIELGVDEAAVVRFNVNAALLHGMTTDVPLLKQSILGINVGGPTALWSGIYVGLQELIGKGTNPCRAVIVLSDGRDNASSETQSTVMNLALSNRIPVFTIGLGRSIDSVGLSELSDLTGGKFFLAPTPDQLLGIYREIARFIQFGLIECKINYTGTCIEDTARRIKVQFDYCGGSDSDSVSVTTPDNIGMAIPVKFSPLGKKVAGGTQFTVPVRLETQLSSTQLPPADGTLAYDTSVLQLIQVRIAPGSIYSNAALTYSMVPGGVRFRIDGSSVVNGTGDVIDVDFVAINPPDTLYSPVTLARWSFDEGCFIPSSEVREICIVPCKTALEILAASNYLCVGDTISLSAEPGFDSYVWYRNGNEIAVGPRTLSITEEGAYYYRAWTDIGCSAISSTTHISAIIKRSYTVRTRSGFLERAGEFTIPLFVEPPLSPSEFVRISFRLQAPSRMKCIGVTDAVHHWTDMLDLNTLDGTVTLSGTPSDSVSEFAQLRFVFDELPIVPEVATISFVESGIALPCIQSYEMEPILLPMDGLCQLLITRKTNVRTHPNPFSDQATIRISIPQTEYVVLRILNVLGVEIHRLAEGEFLSGDHEFHFNATSLPSGVYIVELVSLSGVSHILALKTNGSN